MMSATVTSPSPSAPGGRENISTTFSNRPDRFKPNSVIAASTVSTRSHGSIAARHNARNIVVLPGIQSPPTITFSPAANALITNSPASAGHTPSRTRSSGDGSGNRWRRMHR